MPADLGHRLAHCLGCTVIDLDEGAGVLAGLEFEQGTDEPTHLVVQRGLFHRTRVRVPVAHVVDVDEDRHRVTTSAPSDGDGAAWGRASQP